MPHLSLSSCCNLTQSRKGLLLGVSSCSGMLGMHFFRILQLHLKLLHLLLQV